MALETERPEWHEIAACKGQIGLFWPVDDVYTPDMLSRIEPICASCPVIETCREWGKDAEYGIWAGELHQPVG